MSWKQQWHHCMLRFCITRMAPGCMYAVVNQDCRTWMLEVLRNRGVQVPRSWIIPLLDQMHLVFQRHGDCNAFQLVGLPSVFGFITRHSLL